MSFNLGSEQSTRDKAWLIRLTPMSIQLGSERVDLPFDIATRLAPMSFNLGSEPLFSNLYLIVT